LLPHLLLLLAAPQEPLTRQVGDATLTLGGEVMGRVEVRDDADLTTAGGETADPMRARVSVGLAADYGAYLRGYAEILASWGDTGESTTEDLQQFYLDLHRPLGDWDLRAGRTELDFGDGRLVSSNRSWLFEPNSFDGLLVSGDQTSPVFRWSAWLTKAANGPADLTDDSFGGFFADWKIGKASAAEAYALLRRQEVGDIEEFTLAGRWHGRTAHGLEWSAFGAAQDGSQIDGRETWAQAAVVTLGKELDYGHRLGLEIGVATGNDDRPGDFQRFTPVYVDQHRYNGRADIFAFANLIDVALLYALAWNERWSLHADLHHFARQSRFDDAYAAYTLVPYGVTGSSTSLGQELDLYAEGRIRDGFWLEFGGALFLAGSAMPTDADQIWLFASLGLSF